VSCAAKEKERIKSLLKWETSEINDQDIRIISDPQQRLHEIHIPADNRDLSFEIEALHEYVHAIHHEILPTVFSISDFISDIPFGLSTDSVEIKYILCSAQDWYVAGYIAKVCPSEYVKYIKNSYYEHLEKQANASSESDYVILGLISAEASKWLGLAVYDDDKVQKYASAFLDSDPGNPTVDHLYALSKRLFEIGNKFKLQLIEQKWKVDCLA
jgi:hypothetical protein